jgi:hypothetical protein
MRGHYIERYAFNISKPVNRYTLKVYIATTDIEYWTQQMQCFKSIHEHFMVLLLHAWQIYLSSPSFLTNQQNKNKLYEGVYVILFV